MNGNTFGKIFQVTTWGESHGPASGAIVDGCPSRLPLSREDFQEDLTRRQGGGSNFTTSRKEDDAVEIESGVFEGQTTGTPIALRIANRSQNSSDYEEYRHLFRPGHADLTTQLKHGHRDHRGGGRASARETTARVAAGVIAKKILLLQGIEITAWVERVGPLAIPADASEAAVSGPLADLKSLRDASALFAPVKDSSSLLQAVNALKEAGDSWGGQVRCRIDGLPAGLGEPLFDKLGALLAHGMMSLPAAVSLEAGGGEAITHLPGSAIRDPIVQTELGPRPSSNRHGGLLGGMSTGLPLLLGIGFHAPTSIPREIETVDARDGSARSVSVTGRHDSFPLPRAVPMVEAMAALVLVDALLRAGRIPESL